MAASAGAHHWGSSAFAGASCVASVLFIGGAIFLHDAFTYTDRHVERVPVNPLALHPENGGPKDLPIARVLVGDEEDEINKQLSQKPKLVIIGGGWGVSTVAINSFQMSLTAPLKAMGVLKTLQSGDYHVTVISPETFTTFTPLLPCASLICRLYLRS